MPLDDALKLDIATVVGTGVGGIAGPIDEWLDRNPGGKVVVCEANRLKYKGNWKLAYDNSGDGYHVVFSHRSLLEMENRLASKDDLRGETDRSGTYLHPVDWYAAKGVEPQTLRLFEVARRGAGSDTL